LKCQFVIHKNPEYFIDPEKFMPERFLSSEGKFIRDDRVMAFGSGKRACPGEPIARTEIFLYMTTIIQRYRVVGPEGSELTMEAAVDGLSRFTKQPLHAIFIPREPTT